LPARGGETLAVAELEANAGRLKTKEWPYAVIELYLGRRSPELMLDAAGKPDEQCVAQFYSGEWYILQNKSAEARAALRKVVETCPKTVTEYADALAELKRLKP
jgi:lipoprotein NlpI